MAVVAGIDEAGYGPLLGPMVVSVTAFRMPEGSDAADLWRLFEGTGDTSGRTRTTVRVADSKVLYRRGNGLGVLEENLLPFVAVLSPLPESVGAFLRRLSAQGPDSLSMYPWYGGKDKKLPRASKLEDIRNRTQALGERLSTSECGFCGARVEVLPVAEFNRQVERCGNKSTALALRVAELMRYLWDGFGEEGIQLSVDRLGGRKWYLPLLHSVFPFCRISVEAESSHRSAYRVSDGTRRMWISFEVDADAQHVPTALASMLSKYTRELLMEMLNEFWTERLPGLRPTAGYVSDGRRFLSEIEEARRAEQIPLDLLARCR